MKKTYMSIFFIPIIFWAVIYFTYTHAWKLDNLNEWEMCEEIYHLATRFADIRNHGLVPSVKTNRMLSHFEEKVLHEVDRRVMELMSMKLDNPEKYKGMLENPNAIGLQVYDECMLDQGL